MFWACPGSSRAGLYSRLAALPEPPQIPFREAASRPVGHDPSRMKLSPRLSGAP